MTIFFIFSFFVAVATGLLADLNFWKIISLAIMWH